MDPEKKLTGEILEEFINKHKARIPRYTDLMDMYKGDHEIKHMDEKEMGKPDNRLVVNFAKYIVDTLNGYFVGNPVKTIHDNKKVADADRKSTRLNSSHLHDALRIFINKHKARIPRYTDLMDMYKGDHEIKHMDEKEMGKPDNRLVVNFAKYIVDTLNGYFVGNPVKTIHDNKKVADAMKLIAKSNSQNDNKAELSKMC